MKINWKQKSKRLHQVIYMGLIVELRSSESESSWYIHWSTNGNNRKFEAFNNFEDADQKARDLIMKRFYEAQKGLYEVFGL